MIFGRKKAEAEAKYPAGTKIRLITMVDESAVPPGTVGVVVSIDDIGTLHMRWENGSSLGLLPDEDRFEVLTEEANA